MNEYIPNHSTYNTKWNKSITFPDYSRILNHIQEDLGKNKVSPCVLHHLYLLTLISKKYYSNEIPENVVTMNSEVILRFENNQEEKIRIVYPEDIKSSEDKSIYSDLGAACLGAQEESFVFYNSGSGYNKAFIEKLIFQPEKEKIFYL